MRVRTMRSVVTMNPPGETNYALRYLPCAYRTRRVLWDCYGPVGLLWAITGARSGVGGAGCRQKSWGWWVPEY